MPAMLMRYQPGIGHREQALKMVTEARVTAERMFGKKVGWECRPFDDCFGFPTFDLVVEVTDNKDKLVGVDSQVQAALLNDMSTHAHADQTIEVWVKRVKGAWDQAIGKIPLDS